MNPNYQQSHNTNNDEIDLFELIITLWRSKWLIIAITLLGTILAYAYTAITIKPSYQASTTITTPNASQLRDLNWGYSTINNTARTLNIGTNYQSEKNFVSGIEFLPPVTTEALNDSLKTTLNSPNVINDFFNTSATDITGNISIDMGKPTNQTNYINISATSDNPQESFDLLTQFLSYNNQVSATDFLQNRESEIQNLIQNTQQNIQSLQKVLNTELTFKINELKQAYNTAKQLNITTPQGNSNDPYLLGTEILAGKIAFLEQQQNNYSYNNEYNLLSTELANLQSITLPQADQIMTYSIVEPATIPATPVPTKKKLIIIIGFLLGGMIGVGVVLLRQSIRNYRQNKKP